MFGYLKNITHPFLDARKFFSRVSIYGQLIEHKSRVALAAWELVLVTGVLDCAYV